MSAAPARAEEIAIIGLSGRYPGAGSVDEYWEILKDGKDCIGPFLDQMETECLLWEPNARLRAQLVEAERR